MAIIVSASFGLRAPWD